MNTIIKPIKYTITAAIVSVLMAFSVPTSAQEVNINTADVATIAKSLSGIGMKKAEAIIAWRTEHGNFTEVSQITQVKGIGNKTIEKNKTDIKL